MIKKASIVFLAIFFSCLVPAAAQVTDTLRADSVKADTIKPEFRVDTNLLNKFRIEPRKNALPVRIRPLQVRPQFIPIEMPDYEIQHWRKWLTVGINFNQVAFSSNWSAGGVSAIAIGTNIVYKTEYNKSPFIYTAEINFLYGRSKNKGQSARKTNDRLFIDNKLATKLSKNWYFFGSLTFESQIDKGFQYPDPNPPILISRFLSPGYITESIGFEYKPSKYFDVRLGTGTARQTLVLDTAIYRNQPSNYGVPIGKKIRNDLAFQGVMSFDKDIMQNLHLNWRYTLFVPYGRPLDFVNHRLDLTLLARVNKLINVTINGTALYNKDMAAGIQATEGLALGIMYKFP
ncbi:hypothetical protein DJ568_09600 [Mucilaginibacter hurinus]|uniref:DUF3078 domain-containing protein n=1 Tax=Mucilaginibacter hurinus TaxID=2201324 RepID=A0A367GNX1_9SPHI|nr:DUF3078 domain-containing protein [Mucilaginibacter hurinus]RCH54735.1 hypothetical protein DJ568_09600 [Mucilaginibacter hurinus]